MRYITTSTITHNVHSLTFAIAMSRNLSSVDLEFKTIYSPWENEQFWGICNTVEDEDVEGAVIFKGIGEKKMFFDIIDDLVEDLTAGGEGMIPFNDAQNVASTHGLNISDGGQFLQRLNQYKWLKTIRSGTGDAYVAPGSRSLLELPQLRALAVKRNISGSNAQSRNLAVQSSAKTEDEYDRNAAPSPRKRTRDRKDNGSDLDAGSQSQRSTQKRSEKPSRFRG